MSLKYVVTYLLDLVAGPNRLSFGSCNLVSLLDGGRLVVFIVIAIVFVVETILVVPRQSVRTEDVHSIHPRVFCISFQIEQSYQRTNRSRRIRSLLSMFRSTFDWYVNVTGEGYVHREWYECARNDCKLARTTNTRKTSMSNWRNYSRIDEVLHEAERLTVLKHHGSRNPSRTRSRAPFNGENRFSNFPEASARVVTMLNSLFTTAINILPQITIRSESLFPLVQVYSMSSFKITSYDWSRSNMSTRKRAMKPYNWHLRDFYRLSKKSSIAQYGFPRC